MVRLVVLLEGDLLLSRYHLVLLMQKRSPRLDDFSGLEHFANVETVSAHGDDPLVLDPWQGEVDDLSNARVSGYLDVHLLCLLVFFDHHFWLEARSLISTSVFVVGSVTCGIVSPWAALMGRLDL